MEWLHCNLCSTRFHRSLKFFITTCGHVLCQKDVLRNEGNNKCPVCKNVFQTTMLSNDLKPEISKYFVPTSEVLSTMASVNQVASFQLTNYMSLLKSVMIKYDNLKRDFIKCQKMIMSLKRENVYLKKKLGPPTGYTPNHFGGGAEFPSFGTPHNEVVLNTPMMLNHKNLRAMNRMRGSNATQDSCDLNTTISGLSGPYRRAQFSRPNHHDSHQVSYDSDAVAMASLTKLNMVGNKMGGLSDRSRNQNHNENHIDADDFGPERLVNFPKNKRTEKKRRTCYG